MTIATRFLSLTLAAAAALGMPATAEACWDGVWAESDNVSISVAGTQTWTPERARRYAKWISRIDALVPAGKTLIVEHGFITVCDEQTGSCTDVEQNWQEDGLFSLFELTADVFGASNRTIANARKTDAQPYTVQVAATVDYDGAYRLADRINLQQLDLGGFMEVGGFPAFNDYAHVVDNYDNGTLNVVVGAFLTKEDADRARTMLEDELGMKGFVRTLDQHTVEWLGC